MSRIVALLAAATAAAACSLGQDVGSEFTIRAEKLYVGDGSVIAPAFVTVKDGKIAAVGPATEGIRSHPAFDAGSLTLTPGFVEGSSSIGLPRGSAENEERSEVTPCVRVAAFIDATDEAFRRHREIGVTTLVITPGNRNVIGGLSVAVKPRDAGARGMVLKEDAALHAVTGPEPAFRNQSPRGGAQSMFARRPNSRMGVVYELRRALQEGCERNECLPMARSCFCEADGKLLAQVTKGEIPIAFVARAEQDILTAINIAEEFKVSNYYLTGAVEAYLARTLLASKRIPVLIGPLYHRAQVPQASFRRGSGGDRNPAVTDRGGILGGPRLLREAGVKFGLSDGSDEEGSTLLDYARAAVRGGLAEGDAIAAISGWPADIAGLGSRVGTVAPGKDADLVLYSGDPLSPASRLVAVVLDGRVVVRARATGSESRRTDP